MFQVADSRRRFPPQQSAVSSSPSSTTTTLSHTVTTYHSSLHIPGGGVELGPRPGFTTMDHTPVMVYIDQNLLIELTKRFPEVPQSTVIELIRQNGNHREHCMMALARESTNYLPHASSGGSLATMDSSQAVNGLRTRSDSAGSRGSISSAPTGQSPSQLHHLGPPNHGAGASSGPNAPPYHHSSSEPHASSSSIHPDHYHMGPSTAPPQPESFVPFPNVGHRSSVDHLEGIVTYSAAYTPDQYRPGGWGEYTPPSGSWAPRPTYYRPPSGTPSRPGQFDQTFPPAREWDRTFSPGSPANKPPSHGGTPTHAAATSRSPATTPTRHGASPTTSPGPGGSYTASSPIHSYQHYTPHRPDTHHHTHPPINTPPHHTHVTHPHRPNPQTKYVSSISKYITASGEQPQSLETSSPYVMTNLASTLPANPAVAATTYHLPPGMVSYEHRAVHPVGSPGDELRGPAPPSEGRESRSGSLAGEDQAYTQSLLVHQRERLEKLKQDMLMLLSHRSHLQQRISRNEECILRRRKQKLSGHGPSVSASDLQKVREENRLLQIDSHLKTLEFDRITKGQAVIGQEDLNEDFYVNLNSGQLTPLPDTSATTTTTTTTSSSHVSYPSSHPPAPPTPVSAGSRDHLRPSERELGNVREVEEGWGCSACTFFNHPDLSCCEMCAMPRVKRVVTVPRLWSSTKSNTVESVHHIASFKYV